MLLVGGLKRELEASRGEGRNVRGAAINFSAGPRAQKGRKGKKAEHECRGADKLVGGPDREGGKLKRKKAMAMFRNTCGGPSPRALFSNQNPEKN